MDRTPIEAAPAALFGDTRGLSQHIRAELRLHGAQTTAIVQFVQHPSQEYDVRANTDSTIETIRVHQDSPFWRRACLGLWPWLRHCDYYVAATSHCPPTPRAADANPRQNSYRLQHCGLLVRDDPPRRPSETILSEIRRYSH